jgi:hypothetical protein
LFATLDTLKIERTTDDMITDTWKIRDTTTTDKHDCVLLEVVTFTTDICPNFLTVGKAHTSDLAKSGVRLLWSLGCNFDTYTTFEWGGLLVIAGLERIHDGAECRSFALLGSGLAWLTH